MQGKEWLYYLIDKFGRSYYMDKGVLKTSTTPKPLTHSPSGWQDTNIAWERNLTEWGTNRNFTLPYEYVLEGADILRNVFWTKNIEEIVYLLMQRQTLIIDTLEYYFFYKFFYKGELDLSTFVDQENKVQVNVMEGGISKQYTANKNTQYEIAPDDVVVKMDGAVLTGKKRFIVLDPSYNHAVTGAGNVKEMIPMQAANSEGLFVNMFFTEAPGSVSDSDYSFIGGEDLSKSDKYNGRVLNDVIFSSVSIKGVVGGEPDQTFPGRVGLDFILETSTGRIINLFSLNHTFIAQTPYPFELTSAQFSLFKDERFFIYTNPNSNQLGNQWRFSEDTIWTYNTLDKIPTTYVKAKFPDKLFDKLGEKMTGVAGNTVSALLASKRNLVVTSGDALRSIAGAVIKTSCNDFRDSFGVILNAGIGVIQNKIQFEEKAFFLKDENAIDLGIVKDIKVDVLNDIMGNVIKIGYPVQDIDDVNGKYSFNNTSVYSTPITRIVKELAFISKYLTDPFVIETYRANLEGKTTTDSNKDNSVFVLNIDYDNPQTFTEDTAGFPAGSTYYNLKRADYDSVEGVPNSSGLFNIEELTPGRLMQKMQSYFNGLFYGFQGQQFVFETTDRNRNLKTTLGSTVVDEDANVNITSSPMLFKPVVFEVVPPFVEELVELLEDNPNRCFKFTHDNGNQYRGFNLKLAIAASSKEEQVMQLLAVPNQDLTTLKNR